MSEVDRTLVITEQDLLKVKYVVSEELGVGWPDPTPPPLQLSTSPTQVAL